MRADRLVAVLLMLQRKGQVTAAQVAAELEVSERTARRDLDALAVAGVPVYSVQGRGGGWRLAGGGRIDLSGLDAEEARALFAVAGPSATVTPEVRSALRKLLRALPEPLQDGAEAAAGAVVVDPAAWDRTGSAPRPALLDDVETAVIDRACLRISYVGRGGTPSDRVVHPLGLAVKGRIWYLVADTEHGMRTFRVDRIASAERTGEAVVRPDGFELSDEWARIVERVDQLRTPLRVTATASARAVPYLRMVLGTRVRTVGPTGRQPTSSDTPGDDPDDPVIVELRGHSVRALAVELAGFGGSVRVDGPDELRDALAEIGDQLLRTYRR